MKQKTLFQGERSKNLLSAHLFMIFYITSSSDHINNALQSKRRKAGPEVGQAQIKLELGFASFKICCIILMITNYLPLHISERNKPVTGISPLIIHYSLPHQPAYPLPFPKTTLLTIHKQSTGN